MFQKFFFTALTGFFMLSALTAQTFLKPLPNTAYKSGEVLKYVIHYGMITGGAASITLNEEDFRGQKVLHAVATGKTTGVVDQIFGVKDIFESFSRPKPACPSGPFAM